MTKLRKLRSSSRLLLAAAALLAGATGAAGCGEDFAPYNRLTSLRVLALKSDPPNPAPGQMARLSAVVYPPELAPGLTYAWSWCPFPQPGGGAFGHTCLATSEQLSEAGMLPAGTLPPTDLGASATPSFTHTAPPEQLAAICAMFRLDCGLGFPVQIRLVVTTDAGPDGRPDTIDTVWTMRLPVDTAAAPNTNPTLGPMFAVIDGQLQLLTAEDPLVTLLRDVETDIQVTIAPENAETYIDPDPDGDSTTNDAREAPERLFLSWFVESGDLDASRTGTNYGEGYTIPLPDALALARENAWTPAKALDYPAGTARLFVVIRDNRGGVGSTSAKVSLGDAP